MISRPIFEAYRAIYESDDFDVAKNFELHGNLNIALEDYCKEHALDPNNVAAWYVNSPYWVGVREVMNRVWFTTLGVCMECITIRSPKTLNDIVEQAIHSDEMERRSSINAWGPEIYKVAEQFKILAYEKGMSYAKLSNPQWWPTATRQHVLVDYNQIAAPHLKLILNKEKTIPTDTALSVKATALTYDLDQRIWAYVDTLLHNFGVQNNK